MSIILDMEGKNKIIKHWQDGSSKALDIMQKLFDTKDYSYALFFGHLAVEKILKAIFVEVNNEHPPMIHKLNRLATLSNLEVSEELYQQLAEITTFNTEGRYEDYKMEFCKRCTKEYAIKQIKIIKDIVEWIKTELIKA